MFHKRIKHIDVGYHFIQGVIAKDNVKVCNIYSHDNPIGMLTKVVSGAQFELRLDLVGITVEVVVTFNFDDYICWLENKFGGYCYCLL